MRKKTFILVVAYIVWLVAGLSCNQTEEPAQPSIIGKWKYIRYETPNSEEDDLTLPGDWIIIYEFKANNVLTMSFESEDIKLSSDGGWFCYQDSNGRRMIGIGHEWHYHYQVTEHELLLFDIYGYTILGGIEYYERIN